MYSSNQSPLPNHEVHGFYPDKLSRATTAEPRRKMTTTTVLEMPPPGDNNSNNNSAATDGLAVKDMIVSGFDQSASMSVWKVCVAAALGIGLGIAFTHIQISADAAKWVAFPGELFIAALNCLIVPLVFCSVVVCIGELMEAGKAASVGGRTVVYFVLCSITASSVGVLTGYAFSSSFLQQHKSAAVKRPLQLRMMCNSGAFLAMEASGLVSCTSSPIVTPNNQSLFTLNDTTSFFSVQTTGYATLSVTDQVFGILMNLVPDNIVNAFATSSTLSVITFAVCFGIALAKSVDKSREGENYPLLLISHMNVICRMLTNKVVSVIPVAIISMIAGSMAKSSSSAEVFKSVGFLIVALFVGLVTLTFGILGTVLFLTTRRNIFSWLRHIVPAQVFIFGCASSIATLPITLRCVESSREVSPALARFVLPLGATSNLNGTAVYMPLACIFMASVSGHGAALTPITYVMLALVGAISSFGVAPVPFSGLVMMITVWRTVFGVDLPPEAFSILVGTDWILNRMRAIVNITNDTILVRIIAHQCGEAVDAAFGDQTQTPMSGSSHPPVTSTTPPTP